MATWHSSLFFTFVLYSCQLLPFINFTMKKTSKVLGIIITYAIITIIGVYFLNGFFN